MDVGELRQQLLNCADGALEPLMYNSLGGKVDTLSQTDLVKQLEQLAVVVGEEVKQMVVPTVEMLPLTNGQKGAPMKKKYPRLLSDVKNHMKKHFKKYLSNVRNHTASSAWR